MMPANTPVTDRYCCRAVTRDMCSGLMVYHCACNPVSACSQGSAPGLARLRDFCIYFKSTLTQCLSHFCVRNWCSLKGQNDDYGCFWEKTEWINLISHGKWIRLRIFLHPTLSYEGFINSTLLIIHMPDKHRTHDWKVASLNPDRRGRRIFFSRVNFVCWLLFSVHSMPMLPL